MTRCRHCGSALGGRLRCVLCGRFGESVDPATALLRKLSQLTRFGLAAEDPPLLEPVED